MPHAKQPSKTSLDIRLAESVVFLRAGDATGRYRSILADAPPGMLRGLLTLTLAKPTRISSIEIELVGKTSTAWPEGVGARRSEISEEHEVYSQSYVLFRAGSGSVPFSNRRTLSVGPGLALDHDDDDGSDHSSEQPHDERRGRDSGAPLAPLNRHPRRHQSVDQTHFQRGFVSHRENDRVPVSPHSPLYSPPYSLESAQFPLSPSASISQRMDTVVESPVGESQLSQDFEESRRTLRNEFETDHNGSPSIRPVRSHSRQNGSSASSLRQDGLYSHRPSLDDERPEFQLGSSTGPAQLRSQSRSTVDHHGRESSRSSDVRDPGAADERGRKNKRFSFASVSNALLDVVRDHVRSRSRSSALDLEGDVTPPRGRTRERSLEGEEHEEDMPHHKDWPTLGRVGEVLGLEADDHKENGDGWKEFRKGVYTYPISFAIPATSPPSLHCDYGSVTWKLKACAHRPGTFTSKLTAAHEITLVACPSEDDTEESESIIVERQWDTQMQYLITISGRSFAIGGVMPVSITFMPWTKMKIHRISVMLEERVDYWTQFKRVVRSDPVVRVALLSLKPTLKDGLAILPLNPDEPKAFERSPFSDLVRPGDDIGEYASNLMGPGPWIIRKDVQLPKSGENKLHFTNKNRRSNISVSHILKIVFRVERGDDSAVDPQTGKRKLFDIVVQTPVHILSVSICFLCAIP
ncbi:hypothetical protein AcV5_002059 [Taiwanofungus camphoratus]|nr:hypothetical protein AcV5_002059 [Antrodia cinnamomea]